MIVLPSTFFERLESSIVPIAALGFLLCIPIALIRKSGTSHVRQFAFEFLMLSFIVGAGIIVADAPWATIHKLSEPKLLPFAWIWISGITITLASSTWNHLKFQSQSKVKSIPPELTELVNQEAVALGISAPKLILTRSNSLLAAVYGNTLYINPTITKNFTESQIRIILKHELTHIKQLHWHRTFAANTTAALLWWHPASYWLKAELEVEREIEADAIASAIDPLFYAETLKQIILVKMKTPALAIQCHASSRRWKSLGISNSGRPLLPALLSIVGAAVFVAPLLKPNTTTEIKLPGHSSLKLSQNARIRPNVTKYRVSDLSSSQTRSFVLKSKLSPDRR